MLARFGVLDDQQPGIGKLVLAGVHEPDGDDLVPLGEAQQGALPSGLADEVGDQHQQGPAPRQPRRGAEELAQVGGRAPAHRAEELAHQGEDLAPPLPGRDGPHVPAVVDDGTEPVAAAHEQLAEHRGELAQDPLLGPLDGTEGHRPGTVDHEPRRELTVFHEVPDEQLVHPGGDVPIDMADVVAPLVGAQVGEVGAVASQEGAVIALQASVEAPDDLPVETA